MTDPKAFGATPAVSHGRGFRIMIGRAAFCLRVWILTVFLLLSPVCGGPFPVTAPSGLIGWWPGDGNPADIMGENDGEPTSLDYVPGLVGPAFQFSGTNSFLGVQNAPALSAITNVTFECWIKNDQQAPFRRILTLTPDWIRLGLDDAGRPTFVIAVFIEGKGQIISIKDAQSLSPGVWHHLAGTYDGESTRLYVDGTLAASDETDSTTSSAGSSPGLVVNYFNAGLVGGLIDEVAVYGRPLTAREIQLHFSAGSAGMAKVPVFTEIGVTFPGIANLVLRGKPGKAVAFESSTNLFDWIPVSTHANPLGTLSWSDATAGAYRMKFFRAVSE